MKIVVERLGGGPVSLDEFANRNGLTMIIRERPLSLGLPRYWASFDRVEIMERGMLRGAHGNGGTPEAAIADYARQIAGQRLAVGAYTDQRREVQAPNDLAAE